MSSGALAPLPPAWPGEMIETGAGRSMFVRRAPSTATDAAPAVFVHGLGGGSATWTDLMELLRDQVEGYAPDLPGFGKSPPSGSYGYDLAAQAGAIGALVDHHLRRPVHLVGNSLGAIATVLLAATRPDLVATLTLVCPALPDLRPRLAPTLVASPLVPGIRGLALRKASGLTPEEQARQTLEGLYGDPQRVNPQRLAETAEEIGDAWAQPHAADAYLGALRAVVTEYLRPGPRRIWRLAKRVQAPVLVLFGAADPLIDVRLAGRASRAFPRARTVIIEGAGHVAHLEVPRVVATQLRSLLLDPW